MNKSLKKEIMFYAIPGILGLVANSLYIVVDGIFVAKMLGPNSLAAVTTVVPVVEILIALSLMISIGCGIYISISKGEKDLNKARSYFNHGLALMLVFSLIIVAFSLLFSKSIVSTLGATDTIFSEAHTYFVYFILFVPFFMLNYALGTWIRNDGQPKLAMISQIIGAVVNIVLDYVFMGPLNLGIAGAAIATGLGPVIGIIIFAPHFLMKKGDLYIQKVKFKFEKIKNILIGGLPSFTIEFSLGLMTFFMNIFISKKIGNGGLAAFGVLGYINLILLSVFLGLGQGTQPLVSRFYGEKDNAKIHEVYKFSVSLSLVLGVIAYALLIAFKKPITHIFIMKSDVALSTLTQTAIGLFFTTYFATGINIATASIFEAKHSIKYSISISLLRSLIILLPVLILFNYFGNESLLWLAVPFTELLVLPISIYLWKQDKAHTDLKFN